MRKPTFPALLLVLGLLASGLAPRTAWGDFLEVSGPGEEPFRPYRIQDWTWEDLASTGLRRITYTVYRSLRPDGGFASQRDGYREPFWSGDPELPSDQGVALFYYLITANDQSTDDSPGEDSAGGGRDVTLPPRCGGAAPLQFLPTLVREQVAGFFDRPMFLASPPGDVDRLFVVERPGVVRIVRNDAIEPVPFLDISAQVDCCRSEMGLLGFAFHPDHATNGRFYMHYSSSVIGSCPPLDNNHCAVVSEFTLSADPDVADPLSERILLVVGQPNSNHDGGWIGFGPDGYLYVAFGDGGGGGDPDETGQDLSRLLGSILRLDVTPDPGAGTEYSIPPDNPFVAMPGARPEIWSWGLRNPWRNSFDRATGDFYIADVGQNQWEEVNVATAAAGAGRGTNFGWDNMEATRCYEPPAGCDMTGLTLPVLEYDHRCGGGCSGFCGGSITGGYVYRGCRMPALHGTYFFADYCCGRISSFVFDGVAATDVNLVHPDLGCAGGIVSFGEDERGELYYLEGDRVWRIVPDF